MPPGDEQISGLVPIESVARKIDEGRKCAKLLCHILHYCKLHWAGGEAGLCGGDLCGSSDIWRADGTIHGKTFVRV